MNITTCVIYEKLRRKDIYIVSGLIVLICLWMASGGLSFNVNGESTAAYENAAGSIFAVMAITAVGLAIYFSVSTIPNEYNRSTSHLVWVRGISQLRYHASLALGNLLSGIIVLAIISLGLIVNMVIQGGISDLVRLPIALLIAGLPMMVLSVCASALSIVLPTMLAGICTLFIGLRGFLNPVITLIGNSIGGTKGKIAVAICEALPNFYQMVSQGTRFLLHQSVDTHVIFGGLLLLYIAAQLFWIAKKKEA